jgi:arylsulfatase A-like enzyme
MAVQFVALVTLGLETRAVWSEQPLAARPPNIVFVLADDLGWSDLACYGGDLHETPRLDQLARQSVRFTQAYAMSVCSPTRASILTGKHAARLGITVWREASLRRRRSERDELDHRLIPPETVSNLPRSETTIAEVLKQAGYVTLHVGKWHVGDADHSPEMHGFDVNIGGTHWGAPATFFHPFAGPFGQVRSPRYVPGLGLGKSGDYLTDRLTDEALRLLEEVGDRPFFLNLWYHAVHTPIEAKAGLVERYENKRRPHHRHQNPTYAAMVHSLDENVGRVLDWLDAKGLAEQTLVVFTSDNGGYINPYREVVVTDNSPLRSGKGSLYEGGIRVPLLARLPGVTQPGTECHEPVVCADHFATLAELVGDRARAATDGRSLLPLFRDSQATLARDAIYFHYPHYYATTTPASAVRAGDWKAIEYLEDNRMELYNLRDDPGEQSDLAGSNPRQAQMLWKLLDAWRREVKAPMPVRSPALPSPSEAERSSG